MERSPSSPDRETPIEALAALRRARFRKRTASIEPFDAFYQAYVTALIVLGAVLFLSGLASGDQLTTAQVDDLVDTLPVILGVITAFVAGLGLRSGSRGGPIAIEAAEVRHVVLAPIDTADVLRRPILRQARFGLFVGAVVGATGGQLLARRTEGNALAWTASGALWAMAVVVLAVGCAWCAAGRRIPRPVATAIAAALLVWPVAEAFDRAPASPFSVLGRIPTWAASFDASALAALPAILAVALLGLRSIGGASVEDMARRSALVGQMRFAATMRDLRTVMVLRRQLLQELPRSTPWIPRRAAARRGGPVVRGWWSLTRTPATRVVRIVGLAVLAGVAGRMAWEGSVPLVAVGGLASFLVGLDLIEPLSQEIDHSILVELSPVSEGAIHAGLLVVPAIAAVLAGAFAVVGAAIGGIDATGLEIASVVAVCTALTGIAGATISTVKGAPDHNDLSLLMLPPEAVGSRLVFQAALPPVIACLGFAPLLFARSAALDGLDPVGALGPGLVLTGLVCAGTVVWVRSRAGLRVQMAEAMATKGD